MAVGLVISELFPHGTKRIGKGIAKSAISNPVERAKMDAAYAADIWLDNTTNYLSQVSRLTSSVTKSGNRMDI